MKKYFIITIDTEGDNLWKKAITPIGLRNITTENSTYIPRFQDLCNKFHFIPTYLTNYEMAVSEPFFLNAREWVKDGACEIGMHMHAWNTPPLYFMPYSPKSHNPYAGEYPREVMWDKLQYLTDVINENFKVRPVSHRGGRWYVGEGYFEDLIKLGYVVDCTITPGVSWKSNIGYSTGGPDFSRYSLKTFYVDKEKKMLEVPPTILKNSYARTLKEIKAKPYDWKQIIEKKLWLRPNGNNITDMLYLVRHETSNLKNDYIEFMLHSSELMPGGSPTFRDRSSIERLYANLEQLFSEISKYYIGISLSNYARLNEK